MVGDNGAPRAIREIFQAESEIALPRGKRTQILPTKIRSIADDFAQILAQQGRHRIQPPLRFDKQIIIDTIAA